MQPGWTAPVQGRVSANDHAAYDTVPTASRLPRSDCLREDRPSLLVHQTAVRMKRALGAAALLGSSSAASVVVGLVTAKATAVLVGPSGMGRIGLLQNFVALGVMLFGLGVSSGVVRLGAQADGAGDAGSIASVTRAGWQITAAGAIAAAIIVLMWRRPLSALLLGGANQGRDAVLMIAAVAFSLAANLRIGLLNARRRVRALAELQVATSIGSGLATVAALGLWRVRGVAIAVVGAMLVSWLVAEYFAHRETAAVEPPRPSDAADARRALIRFGVPYTGSLLVGAGVQLILPSLVLHTLGQQEVGYYRAAVGISTAYLTILLTAMARDYYPHVVAAGRNRAQLATLVNQQQRLVMFAGAPIILALLALAPIAVPLVYARSFAPAVEVLQWILLGELFRFSSWTLAFVVLAQSRSSVYFLTESVAGATLFGASWFGSSIVGRAGMGMAYLLTYALYLALSYAVVRRTVGPVWRAANLLPVLSAFAAGMLVVSLPALGLGAHRVSIGLVVALAAAAIGAHAIRRELRAERDVIAGAAPAGGRVC